MKTRIVSGLIMAPLLILVLIGGPCITAMGFFIALMGIWELFRGFKAMDIKPSYVVAVVSVVLLYILDISFKYVLKEQVSAHFYLLWLFVTVLMCLLYLFKIEDRRLEDAMATITGIVYVGFFSYHAVMTEDYFREAFGSGGGFSVSPVWLIIITAFCTDIFAYFGGYFLGKHKLCPVISPKKTVEGSVCGIVGSVVFTGIFAWFFADRALFAGFLLLGAAGGIISQLGDLTASIFKRKMGIKDYGNLIPGHGGIMDRFDSILFTAPMVFYGLFIIYSAASGFNIMG